MHDHAQKKCNFRQASSPFVSVMQRYFLEMSFDGTAYHGWQAQHNALSVQRVLESALRRITGEQIRTTGAGRTDAGVHARYFTVHMDTGHALMGQRQQFLHQLNAVLPPDIAVHNIIPVKDDAHARYSALSRTYEYAISGRKDPFRAPFSWLFTVPLDVKAMQEASGKLLRYSDFACFCKKHGGSLTSICHVKRADWRQEGSLLLFTIESDRFLRNMVRAIVGNLVRVGLGKCDPASFASVIEGGDRSRASFSAPACGLSLVAVSYPPGMLDPVG